MRVVAKDRVAVEVQSGKYAFVAFDLFVKHLLFYSGDVINVGVEILPVKAMATDPPVPLLIIGIAP